MSVGSIFGAIAGLVALVGLAVSVVLLIADWGSERANHRVRTVHRGIIAACAPFIVAAVISIARTDIPFY
jgi:hypothetical protein